MRNLIFIFIAAVLIAGCDPPKTMNVHLKGKVVDLGTERFDLTRNGASSLVGKGRNISVSIDGNGNFEVFIQLDKPEYYSISRQLLYLSPGDDLHLSITPKPEEASFSGQGEEANVYLKNRLYSHGGSFLESGKNVRDDFESTRRLVDSLADVRRAELKALKGVSSEFKELEQARITADLVNSYIYYVYYSKEAKSIESREEMNLLSDRHFEAITALVNPLYKTIADDRFLEIPVVRDVFAYRTNYAGWFEGIPESDFASELFSASEYAEQLNNNASQEVLDEVEAAIPEIKDPDVANELRLLVDKVKKLQPGQPAFDFAFADTAGVTKRLSDFKGKVVYIDFWATWCGPCIAESPHYESLAEKFAGKDVIFLPISVDKTADVWLTYLAKHQKKLTQYHTTDAGFSDAWNLRFIPRFVLIDREQKIVDAYAHPPSNENAEKILDELIN